jgi:hypothetical protein
MAVRFCPCPQDCCDQMCVLPAHECECGRALLGAVVVEAWPMPFHKRRRSLKRKRKRACGSYGSGSRVRSPVR